MKKYLRLLTMLFLTALLFVSTGRLRAQDKTKKPDKGPAVYTFTERQIDTMVTYFRAASQILYRRGSGISLDEAGDLTALQKAILANINAQTTKLHPELQKRIDSLKRTNKNH